MVTEQNKILWENAGHFAEALGWAEEEEVFQDMDLSVDKSTVKHTDPAFGRCSRGRDVSPATAAINGYNLENSDVVALV
jgi:hypothetical protein